MKTLQIALISFIVFNFTDSLFAQNPRQKQIEKLEKSINKLDQEIQSDEAEIAVIDKQIEARINKIIEIVTSIKDSHDSRRRAVKMQEDIIKGLVQNIQTYKSGKKKLEAKMNMRNTAIPKEDMEKFVDELDDKIEARIEQMIEVTSSMATFHTGGYNSTGASYSNRKASKHAEKVKKNVVKKLDKKISELEQENSKLAKNGDSESTEQIQANEEKIIKRQGQIESVVTKKNHKPKVAVGKKGIKMRDKLIKQNVAEAKKSFNKLRALYQSLYQKKAKSHQLQKRLASIKK